MSKIKFIDLFAGIGGLSLPFRELGLECVFSSEIDKFASEAYFNNFNEMPFGDIKEIPENLIPSHDILLGGFPCQAFSIAGKRKGFADERGNLFYEITRILSFHKPKAFLLENVKGLTNHDKGNTFKTIQSELINLGYKIFYKVLNARDFGLPQNRQRIYIVGFLDHSINFSFPKEFNRETQVSDILEPKVDLKYTISDQLWKSHQERKKRNKAKGNGFGYSLVYKNSKYTNTLSARYYKDGSEILLHQKNNNPRKLTPRECARLQGFSDEFKIVVSDNQAYKQFGNSVAVAVVREIAKEIIKELGNIGVNQMNINLIERKKWEDNILFYTILKLLIQSQIKVSKLLKLQKLIENSADNVLSSHNWTEIIKNTLNSTKKDKTIDICDLLLKNSLEINKFILFLDFAISLLELKELLMKKVPIFTESLILEKSKCLDSLSLKNDIDGTDYAYIYRVVFSLIVDMLLKAENNVNKFTLNELDTDILKLNQKVKFITENSNLNSATIFNLIINESVNQSIKSNAGSSYEDRVLEKLLSLGINSHIKRGIHDSKISSVEYDFIVEYGKTKVGISAKRTLKERYKQNLENVSELDVDAMLVITLGHDLSETKMKNILQKEGQYILVSQEIYNTKKFLQQNKRIFSSENFDFSMLEI